MLDHAIREAFNRAPRHYSDINRIRTELRDTIDNINRSEDFSREHKAELVGEAREKAAVALQRIATQLKGDINAIHSYKPQAAGPMNGVLYELQLGRSMTRVRDLLAAGQSAAAVITAAEQEKDPMLLQALRLTAPDNIRANKNISPADKEIRISQVGHGIDIAMARSFADTDEGKYLGARLRSDIHYEAATQMLQSVQIEAASHRINTLRDGYTESDLANRLAHLDTELGAA